MLWIGSVVLGATSLAGPASQAPERAVLLDTAADTERAAAEETPLGIEAGLAVVGAYRWRGCVCEDDGDGGFLFAGLTVEL